MDIFSSAKGKLIVSRTMQCLAFLSIVNTILNYYKSNVNLIIALFLLLLILGVNNYIRIRFHLVMKARWYLLSYVVSVLIIGFFSYKLGCFGTEAFNALLLIEILVLNEKVNIPVVFFTFAAYCISNVAGIDFTDFNTIQNVLINYLCLFSIVFVFRNVLVEKTNMENLNKELKAANLTLKKYSAKIEELTIAKERTRIAQEIHDSLGHSLIALKMNLEYAENILDSQPMKSKEVINKAQNITKDCINNLRKAVSLLKEDNSVEKLREAINELFQNFMETNSIKLYLEMDDTLEAVNPDIKNCIYKTVREAVTNGIKHGNATAFTIEIFKSLGMIILKVKNNGLDCSNMINSNGTKGMEARIHALGGNVNFISEKDCGFAIEASIPELSEA